jgi:hypothetical protein
LMGLLPLDVTQRMSDKVWSPELETKILDTPAELACDSTSTRLPARSVEMLFMMDFLLPEIIWSGIFCTINSINIAPH